MNYKVLWVMYSVFSELKTCLIMMSRLIRKLENSIFVLRFKITRGW